MACGECVIPPLGYPGCYPPAIPTDVGRRIVRVSVPGLQGPPGETGALGYSTRTCASLGALSAAVEKSGIALDTLTEEGSYVVTGATGLPADFTADPVFVTVTKAGTATVQMVGGVQGAEYKLFARTAADGAYGEFAQIGAKTDLTDYAKKSEVATQISEAVNPVKTTAEAAQAKANENAGKITALGATVGEHTTKLTSLESQVQTNTAAIQKNAGDITTINVTLEELQATDIVLSGDFSDPHKQLVNLVDNTNFQISGSNIQNGSSSYNKNSGTSYGYIKLTTKEQCTLSVTGYVSSESNSDFGGVYVGSKIYKPTQSQAKNGTADSTGTYLIRQSGSNSSKEYTMTLTANTTYYLNFFYVKDSSSNSNSDQIFVSKIQYRAVV